MRRHSRPPLPSLPSRIKRRRRHSRPRLPSPPPASNAGRLRAEDGREWTRGSSLGEAEVLPQLPHAHTVFAVRDTEVVAVPSAVLTFVAQRHPKAR